MRDLDDKIPAHLLTISRTPGQRAGMGAQRKCEEKQKGTECNYTFHCLRLTYAGSSLHLRILLVNLTVNAFNIMLEWRKF